MYIYIYICERYIRYVVSTGWCFNDDTNKNDIAPYFNAVGYERMIPNFFLNMLQAYTLKRKI